jgi:hypothetical protein
MTTQLRTKAACTFFVKLYKSPKKAVIAIKSRVTAALDDGTAAECQYCSGLAPPTTLDHFLGKAAIPELSLYAPNLVPCCPDCNNIRGRAATFSASGDRRAVHFYDDDIDALPELLVVDITLLGTGVPSVKYSVASSPHPLQQVFERHFEALHLARRYATKAASQLLLIKTRSRTSNANQQSLSEILVNDADARNALFGRNDHLATLFRSIAVSPAILDWAVLP